MQFLVNITPDDYRKYFYFLEPEAEEVDGSLQEEWSWSTREWILNTLMTAGFFGVVGYVLYSKNLDYWIQHPVITTACVIVLLFVSLSAVANFEARLVRWPRNYDRVDHTALREGFNLGEAHFDLRPEGLGVTFALVRDLYAWQGFEGVDEGPEAFYLTFPYGETIIVPKRAFADEATRERFKDLATSRIGSRA